MQYGRHGVHNSLNARQISGRAQNSGNSEQQGSDSDESYLDDDSSLRETSSSCLTVTEDEKPQRWSIGDRWNKATTSRARLGARNQEVCNQCNQEVCKAKTLDWTHFPSTTCYTIAPERKDQKRGVTPPPAPGTYDIPTLIGAKHRIYKNTPSYSFSTTPRTTIFEQSDEKKPHVGTYSPNLDFSRPRNPSYMIPQLSSKFELHKYRPPKEKKPDFATYNLARMEFTRPRNPSYAFPKEKLARGAETSNEKKFINMLKPDFGSYDLPKLEVNHLRNPSYTFPKEKLERNLGTSSVKRAMTRLQARTDESSGEEDEEL